VDPKVIETLRSAQRFGFFGDGPIDAAIEHSRAFVEAIGDLHPGSRIADLGSGGGLPGLVVGDRYHECSLLLIDRRQKRSDFLQLAVRRLGWTHVEVAETDVREVIRAVEATVVAPFDVVTARSFGPPEVTLRSGRALLATGGRIVISEPPAGDRWPTPLLAELGLTSVRLGPVRVFSQA
jgi:16S rRNA (guanine527-N7)-methyltransferase